MLRNVVSEWETDDETISSLYNQAFIAACTAQPSSRKKGSRGTSRFLWLSSARLQTKRDTRQRSLNSTNVLFLQLPWTPLRAIYLFVATVYSPISLLRSFMPPVQILSLPFLTQSYKTRISTFSSSSLHVLTLSYHPCLHSNLPRCNFFQTKLFGVHTMSNKNASFGAEFADKVALSYVYHTKSCVVLWMDH
jgi:hypothetical protein